jgi:phage baseplate assembly protein W
MSWKFLGTGWQIPLAFSGGRLQTASEEACVEQAIWAILETAPGERVMRPEFGCAIHDLVFAAPNPQLVGQIHAAVHGALARFEPRIEVLGIDVVPDDDRPGLLRIEIDYRLRAASSRFSFVYPFYLDHGGARGE